jgi:hypothetical protein
LPPEELADPNRDRGAAQIKQLQQSGDRHDLVFLAVHRQLSQHRLVLVHEHADQMRGRGVVPGVLEAATNPLPVDRQKLAARRAGQCLAPVHEALLKRVRIEPRKDPLEGVGAGDAVRQVQKRLEPFVFGLAKIRHVRPTVGTADHRANSDHDHVRKLVPLALRPARVRQVRKVFLNRVRCHP